MPVPDPKDRPAIEAAVKEFVGPRDMTSEEYDLDPDFWIDEFMSSYIIPRAVDADAPDTDFEGIEAVAREIIAEMMRAEKAAPPPTEVEKLQKEIKVLEWDAERREQDIQGLHRLLDQQKDRTLDRLQYEANRLRVTLMDVRRIAEAAKDTDDIEQAQYELARIGRLANLALTIHEATKH